MVGSSELFFFDIPKIITKIDFDESQFQWIKRQTCVDDAGLASADMFLDACLLSGSAFLPTFPQLNDPPIRKSPKFQGAIDMIKQSGANGLAICLSYQDDAQMRRTEYLDKYKRSRLAVKHEIVLTSGGKVEPFDKENVPSDLHELVGQRLPDELYYYHSIGGIGSRMLNQLTTQQILETEPLSGGDSEDYRALVRTKLTPLRSSALSLLSHSLTRAYQHRPVTLKLWFELDHAETIRPSSQAPLQAQMQKWRVPEEVFSGALNFKVSVHYV